MSAPRVIFFGNNRLGFDILQFLKAADADIIGLVVQEKAKSKLRQELIELSGLPPECCFDTEQLSEPKHVRRLRELCPDIGVSALYGRKITPDILDCFKRGIANLHPSLLPLNRGVYTETWSIWENTSAGASLHWIDEGIDTGPLISQIEVRVEDVDTAQSLHLKQYDAARALFAREWPGIASETSQALAQKASQATRHFKSQLSHLQHVDPDKMMSAEQWMRLLRALAMPRENGRIRLTVGDIQYKLHFESIDHDT